MGRLILSTTMTVDALVSVADWYVGEGGHEEASRSFIAGSDGMDGAWDVARALSARLGL